MFAVRRSVIVAVLLLLAAAPTLAQPSLESKHTALIEAFAACYDLPAFSKEAGQEWVGRLASTFKARFPGEGWGTKRASNSRPLSNESIARPYGTNRLVSYDLIIGAGAPGQRLEPRAHPEDISDQVFVAVDAADHLAECGGSAPSPGTPPPTSPPPATTVDLSRVLAELQASRDTQAQQLAVLLGMADALRQVHTALEEVKAHDLVSANEQRVTRAELAAALERVRAALAGTLRVRVGF